MKCHTIILVLTLVFNTCVNIKLFNIKFPKLIKKIEEKKEQFKGTKYIKTLEIIVFIKMDGLD